MTPTFHAIVMYLVSLLACAPGIKAELRTRLNVVSPTPIGRMVIVVNVMSRFDRGMNLEFKAELKKRFAACGVAAVIGETGPLDLDFEQELAAGMQAFQPDAVMFIVPRGGELVIQSGIYDTDLKFEVKLFAVATRREVWRSNMKVRFVWTWLNAAFRGISKSWGRKVASRIIGRLRDDRVLKRCTAA